MELDTPEVFTVYIRNPYWSQKTAVSVNGETVPVNAGYIGITREWKRGDTISVELDMRTEAIYPVPYGSQILMTKVARGVGVQVPSFDKEDPIAKNHIALRRGPLMLAQDSRLGYSVDEAIAVKTKDGYVDVSLSDADGTFDAILKVRVPLSDGTDMPLVDYASAGKLWTEESKMVVWMLTK